MYIVIFYSCDGILMEYLSLDYSPKLNDAIVVDGELRQVVTRDLYDYPGYETLVYYCELSLPKVATDMEHPRLELTYEHRLNKANKKSSISRIVRDERRWN